MTNFLITKVLNEYNWKVVLSTLNIDYLKAKRKSYRYLTYREKIQYAHGTNIKFHNHDSTYMVIDMEFKSINNDDEIEFY